jgi:hypothetical protein
MVYKEIVLQAKHLSLHEQVMLVEELIHTIREATTPVLEQRSRNVIPFSELRGALKSEASVVAEQALEEVYVDHLMEKYL